MPMALATALVARTAAHLGMKRREFRAGNICDSKPRTDLEEIKNIDIATVDCDHLLSRENVLKIKKDIGATRYPFKNIFGWCGANTASAGK